MAALRPPTLQYTKHVSRTIRTVSHKSALSRPREDGALHVVRVLAEVRSGLDVAAVELVAQHMAGVLLWLLPRCWGWFAEK